jgi:hypothetical protein
MFAGFFIIMIRRIVSHALRREPERQAPAFN